MDYQKIIDQRTKNKPPGLFSLPLDWEHMAYINYAIPPERIAKYIPDKFLSVLKFPIQGKSLAMISVVTFYNKYYLFGKSFYLGFPQVNIRIYILDEQTQEPQILILKLVSGSFYHIVPQLLWGMPWQGGKFETDFSYDIETKRYASYKLRIASQGISGIIDIADTGKKIENKEGFANLTHMQLILVHPEAAFSSKGDLGNISVVHLQHNEPDLTQGTLNEFYLDYLEEQEILTKEEMLKPHSIFITPLVNCKVGLPPRSLT